MGHPKAYGPGWPKVRPCLSCDRPRRSYSPTDRICATCKRTVWSALDGSIDVAGSPSLTVVGDNAGTKIDTTVTIMDAEGRVIDRMPADKFATRGAPPSPPKPVKPPAKRRGPAPLPITPERVAQMSVNARAELRYRLRQAGQPIPSFLAPVGRHAA